MAHQITKLDTVYTPQGEFADTWHGLETVTTGAIDLTGANIPRVFSPVVQCGFKPDFESPLTELPGDLADEITANPIEGWKLIMADLRDQGKGIFPLHVAKKDYQIHQNRALYNSMVSAAKSVLGEKDFSIATVGTLGGFSQFFISIAIKGATDFSPAENDAWKSFFNLVSSHNSLVASQTLLSVIRIVCMNTVQASIADAANTGANAKIKHTKNSLELVTPATFEANLRVWIQERDSLKATLNALKGEKMTLDGFRAFAAGVQSNASTDYLSTVAFNRVTELTELFIRGKGNSGQTRYDALNAFTEYFTSGNGVGNPANVKTSKRLASASFGQGNAWKLTALDALKTPEAFQATIARGEILFSDKLKAMAAAN